MAEASAELGVHWAARWYKSARDEIVSKYFKPYGFEPNGRIEPDLAGAIFVPVGVAGYAAYVSEPRPADEEYVESRYFDIDVAALETLDEREKPGLLRKLDDTLPPLLRAGSCCCQWCAPQFDVQACDRVVPFQ